MSSLAGNSGFDGKSSKRRANRKDKKNSPLINKRRKRSSSPGKINCQCSFTEPSFMSSSGSKIEIPISTMIESGFQHKVMKKQASILESKKNKLSDDLKSTKKHNRELQNIVKRLEEDAKDAKERESRLLHTLSVSKKEISKSQKNTQKLEKEVRDLTTRSSSLKKKLNKAEAECFKLQQTKSDSSSMFTDMSNNFRELIETSLACAVCSEIIAVATTISCGHTFCDDCIEQWKKKKKNCPICRAEITSQSGTIVMDEFLDKVVTHFFPPCSRKQRETLVAERKQKQEARKLTAASEEGQQEDSSDSSSETNEEWDTSEQEMGSQSVLSFNAYDDSHRSTHVRFGDDWTDGGSILGRLRMRFAFESSSDDSTYSPREPSDTNGESSYDSSSSSDQDTSSTSSCDD